MSENETPLHIRQAEGLEQLAAMIRTNPALAEHFDQAFRYMGHHVFTDAKDVLGLFARAAAHGGAKVTKEYSSSFAAVYADWGALRYKIQTEREQVCERVVVGTETVTKTVKDPAKLAEVPEVEVTEEVPVYEWQCKPLLSSTSGGAR